MPYHFNKTNHINLRRAFTLVELFIAIVVIAILATLAYVAYNGITAKAADSKVQAELRNVAALLAAENAVHGAYPQDLSSLNNGSGYEVEGDLVVNYAVVDDGFCLDIRPVDSSRSYFLTSSAATIQEGDCGNTGVNQSTSNQIATASDHTCTIIAGNLYCWGYGLYGKLGLGSHTNYYSPMLVGGSLSGKSISNVSLGAVHTCSLTDGDLYCWGWNYNGQLGVGDKNDRLVPTLVGGVLADKEVTEIALGRNHTCAVADGDLYCWGGNDYSQLGLGSTELETDPGGGLIIPEPGSGDVTTPTLVAGGLSGRTVTDVALGYNHSCAIGDGDVFCWGRNQVGEAGGASSDWTISEPLRVTNNLSGKVATQIDAGNRHTCALVEGGVYCWGQNTYGQIGIGTTSTSMSTPSLAGGALVGKTVDSIASGDAHVCALDGSDLYCWGRNTYGQLGKNDTTSSYQPIAVTSGISGKSLSGLTSFGMSNTTCVVSGTELYCWGRNNYGQLGLGDSGTGTDRTVPTVLTAAPWL